MRRKKQAALSMCWRANCNSMPVGMHEVLEAGDCAYMQSEMALAMSAIGKHLPDLVG